jgi:type III secretion system chaperone SycN
MDHKELMEAFMNRIGLSGMTDAGKNPAVFNLGGLGQLALETAENGESFTMSLALPLPPYESERLLTALRLCHPDRIHPFPLSCGLFHDHLIFVSRQEQAGLTPATLENQAMFLIDSAKAAGF